MKSYFKFLARMTGDIFGNLRRTYALAVFEYKLGTKNMVLGQLWKLLNPMIQTGVYWLVFGIGIRSGDPIDGVPYVVWLTCGLTPWLMMSHSVSTPANSIYSKATMLTRANIPTCLVPISSVFAVLMDSSWSVLIMIVIFLCNGCVPTWTAIGIIYYCLCIVAFASVCSLVTSVLVMLARDFNRIIQAVMRMIYFLSPVFWKPGRSLPEAFMLFDRCNPFGYVIRGFRNSLLFDIPFWEDIQGMIIFWTIVIVMYLLGAACQSKLRKNLLDFL